MKNTGMIAVIFGVIGFTTQYGSHANAQQTDAHHEHFVKLRQDMR